MPDPGAAGQYALRKSATRRYRLTHKPRRLKDVVCLPRLRDLSNVCVFEIDPYATQYTINFDGPDGIRERVVPDWSGMGGLGNAWYTDYFTYDAEGSLVERLRWEPLTQSPGTGNRLGPYLLDTRAYDACGMLIHSVDSATQQEEPIHDADNAGFGAQYGYQTDAETGLVLAGHRYYQPNTRRWLNRDTIGYSGGINLYGYCGNDPVNEIDPSGDEPCMNPFDFRHFWTVKNLFLGSVHLNQPALGDAADDHTGDVEAGEASGLSPLTRSPQATMSQARQDMVRNGGGMALSSIPMPGGEADGLAVVKAADQAGTAVTGAQIVSASVALVKGTIAANKVAGDNFRNEIAAGYAAMGYRVEVEKVIQTPFGTRRMDVAIVDKSGKLLRGIETKMGSSRYLFWQQIKDGWITATTGAPIEVFRWKH